MCFIRKKKTIREFTGDITSRHFDHPDTSVRFIDYLEGKLLFLSLISTVQNQRIHGPLKCIPYYFFFLVGKDRWTTQGPRSLSFEGPLYSSPSLLSPCVYKLSPILNKINFSTV